MLQKLYEKDVKESEKDQNFIFFRYLRRWIFIMVSFFALTGVKMF